jgi:hypothetical protein
MKYINLILSLQIITYISCFLRAKHICKTEQDPKNDNILTLSLTDAQFFSTRNRARAINLLNPDIRSEGVNLKLTSQSYEFNGKKVDFNKADKVVSVVTDSFTLDGKDVTYSYIYLVLHHDDGYIVAIISNSQTCSVESFLNDSEIWYESLGRDDIRDPNDEENEVDALKETKDEDGEIKSKKLKKAKSQKNNMIADPGNDQLRKTKSSGASQKNNMIADPGNDQLRKTKSSGALKKGKSLTDSKHVKNVIEMCKNCFSKIIGGEKTTDGQGNTFEEKKPLIENEIK